MHRLSVEEVGLLRESGKILRKTLDEVVLSVKPGISALSLDQLAESLIRKQGGTPSFKNYPSQRGRSFPSALCVSINDEIVHGIPLKNKIIREGDIVSLDCGVNYRGINTDMAKSVIAGKARNKNDEKLIKVTDTALKLGISEAKIGNKVGDIGHAIQSYVEREGFNVVRALVGHGIGREVHCDPQVPNFGRKGDGFSLIPGIAIAIEPMVVSGDYNVQTKDDDWTVTTIDGKRAAHFEHTIYIGERKSEIITA